MRNAAHVAAELATALHDADGRVTLPGFYDAVRPVTDDVRAADRRAALLRRRVRRPRRAARRRTGEAGFSTLERIWVRPTAEVTGIQAGYAGEGMKTIVPADRHAEGHVPAGARPGPGRGHRRRSTRWLDAHVPDGVEVDVTPIGGVAPALTPLDHPGGARGRAR